MCEKTGKASKLGAFIMIAFNLLTLIFSMCFFSLSLWIIVSPNTLHSNVQMYGSPTAKMLITNNTLSLQMGIVSAFLSVFFFFISAMGLYGAISASVFLLFMYAALVILILLLECSVMFYVSSNIVEKGLQDQPSIISHYIRTSLNCCSENRNDAKLLELPWSCCNETYYDNNCTLEVSYKNNCQEKITEWQNKYSTVIYVTLAVIHIVLSSCSLLRRRYSASLSHT